jgi:5-dehydro-4-deoxyglucarate dehydratase
VARPTFDGERILFFPVTPVGADGRPRPDLLGVHLEERLAWGPGAVFAACGTGEFSSLSVSGYRDVLEAAVRTVAGRVPVIGGAGGPLGHAIEVARAARDAGADGLLVMPPYLARGPQMGLLAYVEAIADATELPLIAYHRDEARFTGASAERLFADQRVIGIKDGVGDLATAQEHVRAAARAGRTDVRCFNGLPTAEVSQAAFDAIGVRDYSSAVFAMAPDIATAYLRALRTGDETTRLRLLDGFYVPFTRLRDETPGFAVALIKAGVRLGGLPAGPVRPPLVDPTPEQESRLRALLVRGRDLVP